MYTIHPLHCGTLWTWKDSITYRLDRDLRVAFPVLSFLLLPEDSDGATVLVDTGVKPEESAYMRKRDREIGPPGGGPGPLIDGLAAHGLDPDDVDAVILTHLHHDHSSHNDLFPDAAFFVQRAELDAARDPLPPVEVSYPEDNVASLCDLRVTVLEGAHRPFEGIELVPSPGHSAGMQSVVVETAGGPHALVGDLAYIGQNLDPANATFTDAAGREIEGTPGSGEYWPPGTMVDLAACYASMARIRDRIGPGGTVVPSHDPAVVGSEYP